MRLFLSALAFLFAVHAAAREESTVVRIAGDHQFKTLVEAWAESSDIAVEFLPVDEPNDTLKTVAAGKADYGLLYGAMTNSHRAMAASISRGRVFETCLGWESPTALVHPENKTTGLTVAELNRILLAPAEINHATSPYKWSWTDAEGKTLAATPELYLPTEGSHEYARIRSILNAKQPFKSGSTQFFKQEAAIERAVASSTAAIGLVAHLRTIPNARILPLQADLQSKAVTPNSKSLADGSYPLKRAITLFSTSRARSKTAQARLREHIVSPKGKNDLSRLGYYPAP